LAQVQYQNIVNENPPPYAEKAMAGCVQKFGLREVILKNEFIFREASERKCATLIDAYLDARSCFEVSV